MSLGNLIESSAHRMLAESSGDLWIVGVVLVLAGSISQNLGNNLASLAYSAKDDEEVDGKDKKNESRSDSEVDKDGEDDSKEDEEMTFWEKNLWAVGTATFVGGSLMTFVAFGFAAQSLLASLESVQFVSNVIFAKLVHKEDITYTMMFATLGIVCGNTLVVLFSTHGATKYSGEDIFGIWRNNFSFHIYLGVMGGIALICEYVYRTYNHSRMVERKLLQFHRFAEPGCYCVASAFVGAFAVVNAKCIAMFLAGDAAAEFAAAPMWTVLITWIVVVAFWLRRMDQGLELFPPLFFIPTLMAFFIFFSIVCGGIFFEEFNSFTGAQFGGFFTGVFCILFGVFFLAPSNEMEVGPLEEGKDTIAKSKSIRRLSFSAIVDDEATGTSDRQSEGASSSNRPKARSRASTMSHPLAALKEAHHRASQIQFVADLENSVQETTNKTMRRASVALGLLNEEDDPSAAAQSESLTSGTDDAPADVEAPVAIA